jgi:mRNA interferase RelE/StbE
MPYHIIVAPRALNDLKQLRPFDERRITAAIANYLSQQPTQTSRSRIKQMQQPFWSQYRMRVDRFRVYYDVDDRAQSVSVLRVLEKGQGTTATRASDEKN